MRNNGSKGKQAIGSILTAGLIISISSLAFQGFTQAAAKEYNKADTVATSYADIQGAEFEGEAKTEPATETLTEQSGVPEGYKKADYTIGSIDLEYYSSQTPAGKDMSKEEAAEIGAQALWNIYGIDLEGQVIEMGYDKGNENIPRSSWYADVFIDGKRTYYFWVDAVTGDLFSVGHDRTLEENVSVAYDKELAENYGEYADLAMKLAAKYDVVHGEIASVRYNCQGYSNNDPDITFDINGENGEVAIMTFSRYDKALTGIGYYAQYKYTLAQIEKMEQGLLEAQ